jgi:hypothetical protein
VFYSLKLLPIQPVDCLNKEGYVEIQWAMLLLIRKDILDIIDLQRQATKPFVVIDFTF